jgi:hypothetical protein
MLKKAVLIVAALSVLVSTSVLPSTNARKVVNVKQGVSLEGLRPVILNILPVLDKISQEVANRDTIITSAVSSRSVLSLHPLGYAIDIRTRDLTEKQLFNYVVEIKIKLSTCYDVVQEPDHIHIEFDPNKGKCDPHDIAICRDNPEFGD